MIEKKEQEIRKNVWNKTRNYNTGLYWEICMIFVSIGMIYSKQSRKRR